MAGPTAEKPTPHEGAAATASNQQPEKKAKGEATGGGAGGLQPDSEGEGQNALEGFLPRLDLFFPEGDLDLRVNRLVNKVFFEGQVKYNIVQGDITAFLRYRYYGFRRTYQLTAFDAVEFSDIQQLSDEFSRVRGILGLTQWPINYHKRSFFLAELDRLISNKQALRFSNNRTNTFIRLGYQLGTPRDDRSNAVVGESRALVERLFSPYQQIGPGDAGFTTGLSYGFDLGPGDFNYVKLEFSGLKRFRLHGKHFLIGRLHGGTFPYKTKIRDETTIPDLVRADRFSIPRQELFRLDGRDNLKGLSDRTEGTDELHTTWELFLPWFLEADRTTRRVHWQNWYWVIYAGYGTAGFSSSIYTDLANYIPDAGIGFEATCRFGKYTFFLSGLVAQALRAGTGPQAQLSVKSYH